MAQSSYHLPFVGSGRRSWDAWHAGNYGSAAWQASMLGTEVLGVRWAGQVRGSGVKAAGKVVIKDKTIKLNNSQQRVIHSLKKQVAEHQQKLKNYIANPDKCDNRGFLKNKPALERERLIQERIDSLKHQIDTFEKDIDAIKNGLKQRCNNSDTYD